MRWFLGLVLVVALVLGALYGVGRFLLPNDLSVTRTVTVDRPRATVFALINDLNIVKEWSPYTARDPAAQVDVTGAAGPGQNMRWDSSVRDVGMGRLSIVESAPNESVSGILELGKRDSAQRAILNTHMEVRRVGSAQSSLAWAITAECGQGYINVPCRYMNLIVRSKIERDLDNGLARLKQTAERVPNVDFEGLQTEVEEVPPLPYVYVPVTTSNHDASQVEAALGTGLAEVDSFMATHALVRTGPQMRVTTDWDTEAQRMSFRVGYPYSGPTPLTVVGVQVGQTPSGRAAHAIHRGPRSQMRDTYARIYAFLEAHRIKRDESKFPWEVVLADGGENQPMQVEIYVPVLDEPAQAQVGSN